MVCRQVQHVFAVLLLVGALEFPFTFLANGSDRLLSFDSSGRERWNQELDVWGSLMLKVERFGDIFLVDLYRSECPVQRMTPTGQTISTWSLPTICQEVIPEEDRFVVLAEEEVGDSADGSYEYDYFVSAFDLNGGELWRFACDEIGDPMFLKANPAGGYVVASSLELARLTADGDLLVLHRHHGCVGLDVPPLILEQDGTAVVAGCASHSTYLQWFDSEGNLTVEAKIPRSGESDGDGEPQLALDADGNVFVANRCSDEEGCIAKFDSAGTHLWSQRFPFDGDGWQSCVLVVDAHGQPVVAVNNYWYAEIIKYDATGNELWTARIDNIEDVPNNDVLEMAVERYGNTYVAAKLCDQEWYDGGCDPNFERYVAIKLDDSGNREWTRRVDDQTTTDDTTEPYSEGSVYVTYTNPLLMIYLSPELAPSSDDDTSDDDDQSSSDDDSDSAGCGC